MLHQQQATNVQYISYFDSIITNDAKCTREIPSRIVMETSNIQQEEGCFQEQIGLLSKKLVMCYIWSIDFYGAEFRHFESRTEVAGKFPHMFLEKD